jgi:hypothetical protein
VRRQFAFAQCDFPVATGAALSSPPRDPAILLVIPICVDGGLGWSRYLSRVGSTVGRCPVDDAPGLEAARLDGAKWTLFKRVMLPLARRPHRCSPRLPGPVAASCGLVITRSADMQVGVALATSTGPPHQLATVATPAPVCAVLLIGSWGGHLLRACRLPGPNSGLVAAHHRGSVRDTPPDPLRSTVLSPSAAFTAATAWTGEGVAPIKIDFNECCAIGGVRSVHQ